MYFPSLFCSLFHVFVFPGESVDKLQHTEAVPAEPVEYQQSRGATEREMPQPFLFSLSYSHTNTFESTGPFTFPPHLQLLLILHFFGIFSFMATCPQPGCFVNMKNVHCPLLCQR